MAAFIPRPSEGQGEGVPQELIEGEIVFLLPSDSDDSDDDGMAFTQANLFFPIKKPQICPRHLGPNQSLEEYNANVEYALELNERHGFQRARIEHQYGDGGIGCFSGLTERRWRHSTTTYLLSYFF